ncbi:MAG: helix-turn-helix domain-containing protein [Firmicutes bacterium]|nr:helix-turn-helix domain-containing protein [Bacillota bacterium]
MNIKELKNIIKNNGLTQADVAKHLGISLRTFNSKINKGIFGSDEMEKMIDLLHIKDPAKIFFGQ